MINNFEIKNFGPIKQIQCKQLGKINLIIGDNGTGKTILLKALYTGIKTLEAYKRGQEPRTASEILVDKLYWTFELDKVGDLVRKGANELLQFQLTFDDRDFSYKFGKDTTKSIHEIENSVFSRQSNSIFLPPKEVLSLHKIILKSREQDEEFGFERRSHESGSLNDVL